MITQQHILFLLRSAKPALKKKYGVSRLALFGSHSRQTATNSCDVNLLVELNKPIGHGFIDLADELELILNHKVDLVSRNGIRPKYYLAIEKELIDV